MEFVIFLKLFYEIIFLDFQLFYERSVSREVLFDVQLYAVIRCQCFNMIMATWDV